MRVTGSFGFGLRFSYLGLMGCVLQWPQLLSAIMASVSCGYKVWGCGPCAGGPQTVKRHSLVFELPKETSSLFLIQNLGIC